MFDNRDEHDRLYYAQGSEARIALGEIRRKRNIIAAYQDGDPPTHSDRNDQLSVTRYRPCGTRTTLFDPPCRATVNVYVRPRRTFTVVEEDREEPGRIDTANLRIPVDTERLKLLPATRLATVLPSS